MDDIRQNTLTVAGVVGYMAFLALLGLNGLEWYAIDERWLFVVLLTSSSLLGVDFGLDVFGRSGSHRPKKPNGD